MPPTLPGPAGSHTPAGRLRFGASLRRAARPPNGPGMSAEPIEDTRVATWWRNAVVYQVYLRSFADFNGDGVGDLPGLRSRLGYLASLGVDAVWITPHYPSGGADGGYDVVDYLAVDPEYGTVDD